MKENIGEVAESDAEKVGGDFGEDATAVSETLPAEFAVSENASQASQMLQEEPPAEELPQLRPQRMTFRKSPS